MTLQEIERDLSHLIRERQQVAAKATAYQQELTDLDEEIADLEAEDERMRADFDVTEQPYYWQR